MKKLITILSVLSLIFVLAVSVSAAPVLRGDMDENGKITAMDARGVLRAAAKLDTITDRQAVIADADGNGTVTAMDARTVLRCAAGLEKELTYVDPDENTDESTTAPIQEPTATQAPENTTDGVQRKELYRYIAYTFDEFMEEFGAMRKLGTSDGTIRYTNDSITLVCNPSVILSGNISNIIVSKDGYTLNGIYVGMSLTAATNTLKENGWIVSSDLITVVELSKIGMLTRITTSNGVVSKIEYGMADAFETTTYPTTAEPTTAEPTTAEPTTPEPTTAEPTTAKPEEPTTQEPTTAEPVTGDITFDELPLQVKQYLSGSFAIDGYNVPVNGDEKKAVSMVVSPDHVKAGMSMETEGSGLSLEILVRDIKGEAKTYIVVPSTKVYCELDSIAMGFLGISPSDIALDYDNSQNTISEIHSGTVTMNGKVHVVYTITSSSGSYSKIYTLYDNIVRIDSFSSDNTLKTVIEVKKFSGDVTEADFSLDGYKKKTFLGIFGSML